MQSILAGCPADGTTPTGRMAAAIASRSGAAIRWMTPEDLEDEVRRQSATGDPDLIVLEPRLPAGSSWIGHDRSVTGVVRSARPAVLLASGSVDWPPRRVLVPVDGAGIDGDVLSGAVAWIEKLCGPAGGVEARTSELSILTVSAHPDELYAYGPRLREEIDRIRGAIGPGTRVSLAHCTRWGARPHKRISAAVRRHDADLLVVRRTDPDDPHGLIGREWFDAIGLVRCPVLALPRRLPGVAVTGEGPGAGSSEARGWPHPDGPDATVGGEIGWTGTSEGA